MWPAPCGLPAGLAPGPHSPYRAAWRRSPRPSSLWGTLLTLVNLTSKLRMGRGRAGGFPSVCPFSTAPLVVAMTGSHSPVPCPRRTSSAWAVRSLLRVTAPRLYAAPHASRPRGPPNWLQDGEREGGRGRGGGDRAAAATPPVVPAPAGAGRSQPDLGCGQRALSAHRHRRAPKPRASFRSPVGCPSASLEGVTRPLN